MAILYAGEIAMAVSGMMVESAANSLGLVVAIITAS